MSHDVLPDMVCIEVCEGPRATHDLVGAFECPVTSGEEGGYVENAKKAFFDYRRQTDETYGLTPAFTFCTVKCEDNGVTTDTLDNILSRLEDVLKDFIAESSLKNEE